MAITDEYSKVVESLDYELRDDEHVGFGLTPDRGHYTSWYGTMLTSLALLVRGEELVLAQAFLDDPETARFVLVTTSLLVVADVDPRAADPSARVRAVPRARVRAIEVSASDVPDNDRLRRFTWPGDVQVTIHHPDLDQPFVVAQRAVDSYNSNRHGAIVRFIEQMRSDMASAE